MSSTTPAEVSANHVAACQNTNAQTGFSGHEKIVSSPNHVLAASATLEAQAMDLCVGRISGIRSATWIWVAVTGSCGTSGNCIIQLGPGRTKDWTTMGWWWAWGRSPLAPGCSGYSDVIPVPDRISNWNLASANFSVNYTSSGSVGTWRGYVDGVEKRNVNDVNICWDHNTVQWFGESWNPGDAIGGCLCYSKFRLSVARYRPTSSTSSLSPNWGTGGCLFQSPRPPYYCTRVYGDALDIWSAR